VRTARRRRRSTDNGERGGKEGAAPDPQAIRQNSRAVTSIDERSDEHGYLPHSVEGETLAIGQIGR